MIRNGPHISSLFAIGVVEELYHTLSIIHTKKKCSLHLGEISRGVGRSCVVDNSILAGVDKLVRRKTNTSVLSTLQAFPPAASTLLKVRHMR